MDAKDKQEVSNMLAPVKTQIAAIQTTLSKLPPSAADALIENRRVRFEEAGEWARHYSNVRMGVTPFLITLTVGILAFKWEPQIGLLPGPGAPFVYLSFTVWVLACFLFFVFTHRTSKQEQNASSHRLYLEVQPPKPVPKSKKYWAGDFPSWAMVALMFGFGVLMRTIEYSRLGLVMLILAGCALLVTVFGRWERPS